jgi:hypothetical protein
MEMDSVLSKKVIKNIKKDLSLVDLADIRLFVVSVGRNKNECDEIFNLIIFWNNLMKIPLLKV